MAAERETNGQKKQEDPPFVPIHAVNDAPECYTQKESPAYKRSLCASVRKISILKRKWRMEFKPLYNRMRYPE